MSNTGLSDQSGRARRRIRSASDAGMTLPELLIAVAVMGLIATVLSSAIIVTLRQEQSTEGRINLARSEQSIGMWLPTDLASAAEVRAAQTEGIEGASYTQADLTPCPGDGEPCPGVTVADGSYALLISWRTLTNDDADAQTRSYRYTNVAYYYSPAGEPFYKLTRIECNKSVVGDAETMIEWSVPTNGGWSCAENTAVTNLPAPPEGWAAGDVVPAGVVKVTVPLLANAQSEEEIDESSATSKNARRVMVTINGGGSGDGASGGSSTISITAGGTTRNEISAASMQGAPTLVEARSRCGGPMVLLADKSDSIITPTNYSSYVRTSMRGFVSTLIGTPVRLQIVQFGSMSNSVGTDGWTRYFDLTDTQPGGDVADLLGPAPFTDVTKGLLAYTSNGGVIPNSTTGNYTNWEEALFRATRTSNGGIPQTVPKSIIFFTDGVPTRDRTSGASFRSDSQDPLLPANSGAWDPYTQSINGSTGLSQDAWNRANYWADQVRSSLQSMVGVYVGDNAAANSPWHTPPVAFLLEYQARTNWTYQTRQNWNHYSDYQRSTNLIYQQASGFTYHSKYRTSTNGGGTWTYVNLAAYNAFSTGGSRVKQTNTNGWWTISSSGSTWYNTNNQTIDEADGVRRVASSWTSPSTISASTYNANNYTVDDTDGFRPRISGSSWTPISKAVYDANNYLSDSNDGYRAQQVSVSKSVYDANNVTGDGTDGFRKTLQGGGGSWVDLVGAAGLADYDLHNTNKNDTDGYRKVPTSGDNPWISISNAEFDANDYVSGDADGYRTFENTDAEGSGYTEPAPDGNRLNIDLIGEVVAGSDQYDLADGSAERPYTTNADVYKGSFAQLETVLKQIALGECGGTLTLMTKNGNSLVTQPFVYQNSAQFSSSNAPLDIVPSTVTTNVSATAAGFDFDIGDGTYRWIEIVPSSVAVGYQFQGWECRAGAKVLDEGVDYFVSPAPAPNNAWQVLKVKVGANEAVSCTHKVTAG